MSTKLNRDQLETLTQKIDTILDHMEEAGEEKMVSLCLVYDHLMAARELLEAQDLELDREHLAACFNLNLLK